MNEIIDLVVIGAGPAGLMTSKTASQSGLKVLLVEKNNNFDQIRRACSAQFILDDGYENEFIKLKHNKIIFTRNKFEVNYTGPLVEVTNKYYKSPKGHTIHFALPHEKAFALKFNKQILLKNLYEECLNSNVDVRLSTLATGGKDNGNYVSLNLKDMRTKNSYTVNAKKLVICEGANARITGLFKFNKNRTYFATALVAKYIMENITGVEPNSWNLFYGTEYFSNSPIIIGPSLYSDRTFEVTISGSTKTRPDTIYKKLINDSPLKDNFEKAKLIDKHACAVKAYTSLLKPYNNNILVIGDSAAFVEVEVQGALMCGYHAAKAIQEELNGKHGFKHYTKWWNDSFEFNSDEYLRVSQGYALVPTYTNDELDYLFSLAENTILEGTYSQYKTPKLIWDEILKHKNKIKSEKPEIYSKIKKMNTMTLTETFKN